MTQILQITRDLAKETVELEVFAGLDGQGRPQYGSPVPFPAHVVEYDGAGKAFDVGRDGSAIRCPIVLYVAGDESVVPVEQDRITLADGRRYIVHERVEVHGLLYNRGELDHTKLRCRVT